HPAGLAGGQVDRRGGQRRRLAQQHVGAGGVLPERGRGRGIARVDEGAAAGLDADRVRDAGVDELAEGELRLAARERAARLVLGEREAALREVIAAVAARLAQRRQARLASRWGIQRGWFPFARQAEDVRVAERDQVGHV